MQGACISLKMGSVNLYYAGEGESTVGNLKNSFSVYMRQGSQVPVCLNKLLLKKGIFTGSII